MDQPARSEYRDVLVVGAGLSGIGAAYHLQTTCPMLSYAVLERRERAGGTWDLFRYPGVRSDTDIFTLGYPHRPWKGRKSVAEGSEILDYIIGAARDSGIDVKIRYSTHVQNANWDSATDLWTVLATVDGQPQTFHARFLFMCTGYFDYDHGYSPDIDGAEDFEGTIVHPQQWPEGLDYTGKRIAVIGSGATAITIVPALAQKAELVAMVQRSPSHIMSIPSELRMTRIVRKILPDRAAHSVIRWFYALVQVGIYQLCRRAPTVAATMLRTTVARRLPKDYPVDVHFKPTHRPSERRLCMALDGDLFRAIRNGSAEVVTDRIDHFTARGVMLMSGRELAADIVVTATGLQLQAFGGIRVSVDGAAIRLNEHFAYKGCMLEGVPNIAFSIGYINASWSLRADISARAVVRLLGYMAEKGYSHAVPDLRGATPASRPMIDLESGYVLRSPDELPLSGTERPWAVRQNFLLDYLDYLFDDITENMRFGPILTAIDGIAS